MLRIPPFRGMILAIINNLRTNNLGKHVMKYTIAMAITTTMAMLPAIIKRFGSETSLIQMQTVFANPSQRMGLMLESQALVLAGVIVGVSWSVLGLYLASFFVESNIKVANAIQASFLMISVLTHGFLRSRIPRLYNFAHFIVISGVTIFMGSETKVSAYTVTSILYPILTGNATIIIISLAVFPEFSSQFLGDVTIETLAETVDVLTRATTWFVTPGGDMSAPDMDPAAPVRNVGAQPGGKEGLGFFKEIRSAFKDPERHLSMHAIPVEATPLESLTDAKVKLRTKLARCQGAQRETNFEISVSALPLSALRPISTVAMGRLVQNAIILIGACESKLVLLTDDENIDIEDGHEMWNEKSSGERETGNAAPRASLDDIGSLYPNSSMTGAKDEEPRSKARPRTDAEKNFMKRLEELKPVREIQSGNPEVLEMILQGLRPPVQKFHDSLKEAVMAVIACMAYCYDVPKLPTGAPSPTGIKLVELDLRIDLFQRAIEEFDQKTTDELTKATYTSNTAVDIMPRVEVFLVASFLLAFRQAAVDILEMLRYARTLVERRQARNDKSRIYPPHLTNFRDWLNSGGEAGNMVVPGTARKEVRNATSAVEDTDAEDPLLREDSHQQEKGDVETASLGQGRVVGSTQGEKRTVRKGATEKQRKQWSKSVQPAFLLKIRRSIADRAEWLKQSDDVKYAIKLAMAVAIVCWPAFVPSLQKWYSDARGLWALLQLILVFEVAIGASLSVFFVRLLGVVVGCTLGYASYEASGGNRAIVILILVIGYIPMIYLQLGTKYVKTSIVSMCSMSAIPMSTLEGSGLSYENLYKRIATFVVGGVAALLMEVCIFPVRARDRMVESLTAAVRQVSYMQAAVSIGIDNPVNIDVRSKSLYIRFNRSRDKAQGALSAAEAFLPFCLSEPRMKGSFKILAPIYAEMIYVLHQIIDRMDNVLHLRMAYGSSVLEDLNPEVYAYRRNVAASASVSLYCVHQALVTRLPMPQFLPSSRLAQLRLVSRVCEVLVQRATDHPGPITQVARKQRFLSWNASTAGEMEIIEYIEEMADLAKLLVGVNAFRSGMLQRPNFKQYMRRVKMRKVPWYQPSQGSDNTSKRGGSAMASAAFGKSKALSGHPAVNAQGKLQEINSSRAMPRDEQKKDDTKGEGGIMSIIARPAFDSSGMEGSHGGQKGKEVDQTRK